MAVAVLLLLLAELLRPVMPANAFAMLSVAGLGEGAAFEVLGVGAVAGEGCALACWVLGVGVGAGVGVGVCLGAAGAMQQQGC